MTRIILQRGMLALLVALGAIGTSGIAQAKPRGFATPEEAVAGVISALEARDRDGLVAVFGPENDDVILSGDPERDRSDWRSLLSAYQAMNRVAVQGDAARLYIGTDQWPMPIPIVKGGDGKWRWDSEAGREEMLNERIGRNELDVIDLMKGYVAVQERFRRVDHDGDGVKEFAGSILSEADKRDGLYWPSAPGVPESPLGDFVARAAAAGYAIGGEDKGPEPYLGYYYKLLARQGDSAPGGAMDYSVNGHMLTGHAMLAFPADYGNSGIMSFMVSEAGTVYEKDLGENTIEAASEIGSFDPGDGWRPVEE